MGRRGCWSPPAVISGRGFDDARLDTLFLTLPISWRGTLAQYAGRLHRVHAAKREVLIYDYVDVREPMLAKRFRWVLLMCLKAVRFEHSLAAIPCPFQGPGLSNRPKTPGSTRLT